MKLVKNRDVMKVVPLIESTFSNKKFVWGDNPVLRWATNNTKLVKVGTQTGNIDVGNYLYGKIERKRRKNDPFMALVHSMTIEDELDVNQSQFFDIGVISF